MMQSKGVKKSYRTLNIKQNMHALIDRNQVQNMFYPNSPFVRNPLVEIEILKRNPIGLKDFMKWLCQTPSITTYRVNLCKSNLNDFKTRLNQLLAQKYEKPPLVFEIPEIPEVVCIGKVNDNNVQIHDTEQRQIVVDSCCGAALLRGAHLYAPGVLAMESGTRQDELVQVYADLDGQCKKGTNTQYKSTNKLFIGQGQVKMQRYQLYGENLSPNGIAVEMLSNVSNVPTLGDLSSTEALLQNLPSIVCVRVLAPKAGEHVLDMCAAPGNKTTHIVEMMTDEGVVVALDKVQSKIKYVQHKITENSYKSVKAFAYDAIKAYAANGNGVINMPPYAANSFDRILLDAPCSALGNRPLLTCSKMTPKMLQSYPIVQRKLFENAVHLLKPQGALVYSTCTVTEAENEELVAWALNKFPQLELVLALPKVGGPGLPNVGLNDEQRNQVQRFGPPDTNANDTIDTVGFFIAKFMKRH